MLTPTMESITAFTPEKSAFRFANPFTTRRKDWRLKRAYRPQSGLGFFECGPYRIIDLRSRIALPQFATKVYLLVGPPQGQTGCSYRRS